MSLIERYIDGWKRHDVQAVLACVTDDCEIVECYGPIYRGKATVEDWLTKWLKTGRVIQWDVTRLWVTDNFESAQWHFCCSVDGTRHEFDGVSVCDLAAGKIRYMREYVTTEPLYEWKGAWR